MAEGKDIGVARNEEPAEPSEYEKAKNIVSYKLTGFSI